MERPNADRLARFESIGEVNPGERLHRDACADSNTVQITIASTFTADSLVRPLEFWMGKLDMVVDVVVTPYGQLMQQLLNPQSSLSRNFTGLNVLLIRTQDWIRDRLDG